MLRRKKPIFILSQILAAILFLSSCTTANYDNCPRWPVAGEKVAQELEKADYSEFPNTWEWIGRLNKLREELELCKH